MTIWIGESMGSFGGRDLTGWWAVAVADDGRWAVKRLTSELAVEHDIAIAMLDRVFDRVLPP